MSVDSIAGRLSNLSMTVCSAAKKGLEYEIVELVGGICMHVTYVCPIAPTGCRTGVFGRGDIKHSIPSQLGERPGRSACECEGE